jgi:adenosylcobinamide kinase/adenosylcobinamide-phosphate guanylyltransferase
MIDYSLPSLELTFLLGGVRAGKSARAVSIARRYANAGVLFVATAEGLDDEMRRRIAAHKAERPTDWETLESHRDLSGDIDRVLSAQHDRFSVVIIDCLTLWVSNILLTLHETDDAETVLAEQTTSLIETMRRHSPRPVGTDVSARCWIVVSNEVGLGIVPSTPVGRRYRDALGRVNSMMAAAASDATLMIAGLALPLKTR